MSLDGCWFHKTQRQRQKNGTQDWRWSDHHQQGTCGRFVGRRQEGRRESAGEDENERLVHLKKGPLRKGKTSRNHDFLDLGSMLVLRGVDEKWSYESWAWFNVENSFSLIRFEFAVTGVFPEWNNNSKKSYGIVDWYPRRKIVHCFGWCHMVFLYRYPGNPTTISSSNRKLTIFSRVVNFQGNQPFFHKFWNDMLRIRWSRWWFQTFF